MVAPVLHDTELTSGIQVETDSKLAREPHTNQGKPGSPLHHCLQNHPQTQEKNYTGTKMWEEKNPFECLEFQSFNFESPLRKLPKATATTLEPTDHNRVERASF